MSKFRKKPVGVEAVQRTVVVVDRKITGQKPPYHLAAITLCTQCGETVWLGTATLHAVQDGAVPLCTQCAVAIIPPESKKLARLIDRPRRRGLEEQ